MSNQSKKFYFIAAFSSAAFAIAGCYGQTLTPDTTEVAEYVPPVTQIEPDASIFEDRVELTTAKRIGLAYTFADFIRLEGHKCKSFSDGLTFSKFWFVSCNERSYAYAIFQDGETYKVKFLPQYLLARFYEKIQQTSDTETGMEMLGDSLYLDIIELP